MHFTVTQRSYCNGYWQSEIPRANLIFHIEEGNISSPSSFAVPISNQLISSSAHHFPHFLLASSPSSHLPLSPSLPGRSRPFPASPSPSLPGQPLTFPFPASHLPGRSPFPSRLFTFPAFLSRPLTFPFPASHLPTRPLIFPALFFPTRPFIFPHALSSSRSPNPPQIRPHLPPNPFLPQIRPLFFPQIPLCISVSLRLLSFTLSGTMHAHRRRLSFTLSGTMHAHRRRLNFTLSGTMHAQTVEEYFLRLGTIWV